MNRNPPHRHRWTLIILIACVMASLISLAYPLYVVRPFRPQGPRELAVALVLLGFQRTIAVLSALGALIAAAVYWRGQPRKWRRNLAAGGAMLACVLAILARVDIFEQMFHPVGRPSFVRASQMKLDRDENVIAIKIGGQSRAYPVRSISYHHVVNDVVETKAIVATY